MGALVVGAWIIWNLGNGFHPKKTNSIKTAQPTSSPLAIETVASITTSTNAFVLETVDGDTIKVQMDGEKNSITIRLLGVNTPETVDPRRPVQCFGKEASAYASRILTGKRVRLEGDPEADEVDPYGRVLRNVILEDETDFNAQLIREGYAYAYVSFPMNKKRKSQLRYFQEEAKRLEIGLWNPKTCAGKK